MEKTFSFKPKNVCSREIRIAYDEDTHIISKVTFVGGCAGNTQGVARLAAGRKLEEIESILEGIKCPGSRGGSTSCPDQLSQAIKSELAS